MRIWCNTFTATNRIGSGFPRGVFLQRSIRGQYRPDWRPGAVSKALVRKYKRVLGHMDILTRKRKAMLRKAMRGKKKEAKKPALIVKKVDGEYTVQMEILKNFSHERLPFQYPYEDKAPEIFSVGRTAAENNKRQLRIARHQRREQRRKSQHIQSTFRNMCEEICMKKYREVIGILPKPDPNDPCCPCFPESPDCFSIVDSCSCEDSTSESSTTETDGDDWVVEFTPPYAKFDALAKRPTLMIHEETQYSYLDFRVKLYDKNGVLIPRFIKGPNGKELCTDLGGFWSPGHEQWLQINEDGWVSMNDVRWVPNEFIGPDGVVYNSEDGEFVDGEGRKFIIGTDGYIKMGKWYFYPPGPFPPYGKPKPPIPPLSWTCLDQYTLPQIISSDFLPHGKDRVWLKERLDEEVRMTGSTELKMPTGKVVPYFHLKRVPQKNHMQGLKYRQSSVTFNLKDSKTVPRKIGFSEARGDRQRSPPFRAGDRVRSPPISPGGDRVRSPPISPGGDRIRSPPISPGGDRVRSPPISPGGHRVRSPPISPEGDRVRSPPISPAADRVRVRSTLISPGRDQVRPVRGATAERVTAGSFSTSTSPIRAMQGATGKTTTINKANQEKKFLPPKSARGSSPRSVSSRLSGVGKLDIDFSNMSEKRAKALKFILDPKNRTALENKKVCKLARMLADGRHISGRHKNCIGHSAGDCCTEYGGICMEIFKLAHQGQSTEEHEVDHGHEREKIASGKTKSKGRKSYDSPTSIPSKLQQQSSGAKRKPTTSNKANQEKNSSLPKSPRASSPRPISNRLSGVGKLDIDFSNMSEKRAKALKFILDPKNRTALENKKVCKLARMLADGRHISGRHKNCFGHSAGDCCTEYGGICMEIFKLAHQGQSTEEHEVDHGHEREKIASGKTKSKGRKSYGSPTTKAQQQFSSAKGISKTQSKRATSPTGRSTDDGGALSSRRERVVKQSKDPRNEAPSELRKEARTVGHYLIGHHKDCYGETSRSCCK